MVLENLLNTRDNALRSTRRVIAGELGSVPVDEHNIGITAKAGFLSPKSAHCDNRHFRIDELIPERESQRGF